MNNKELDFQKHFSIKESFNLKDKIAVITGGGGLLGEKHAEAINELGGTTVLLDINKDKALINANNIDPARTVWRRVKFHQRNNNK